MTIEPANLIIGSVFLGIVIIYLIHIQLRRKEYKKIALVLGAEYQSQGFFKSGKISGKKSEKKFTIENMEIGGGEGPTTWTIISVNCENKGIPLEVHGAFFNNFPNWEHVFIKDNRKEQIFSFYIVNSANKRLKLEEKHKSLVQNLFQETALLNSNFIKKGWFQIGQNEIFLCKRGIIKDIEIIKQIIQLLINIACHIEAAPIT